MQDKIISYAQNFEDIMLYRALKNVKNGFYIDIGAADPIAESVSKLFYDKGWRGINIEPNTDNFKKLSSNRPNDINLNVAISDQNINNVDFFEYLTPGFYNSGSLDLQHVELTKKFGFLVNNYKVNILTLDNIFETYKLKDVHWLKIDVEGSEYNVLKGWNLNINPWIVVIESFDNYSLEQSYEKWEFMLFKKGYKFVYSDFVNRFYLHNNHDELNKFFMYGPNCFDDFYLHAYSPYIDPNCLNDEDIENAQITKLKWELTGLQNQICCLYNSKSWKITKPMRFLYKILKKFI
jgi:FkbM family methyltransferase